MSTSQTTTFVTAVVLALMLVVALWPMRDGAASNEDAFGPDNRSTLHPMAAVDTNNNDIGGSFRRRRYAELAEPGP